MRNLKYLLQNSCRIFLIACLLAGVPKLLPAQSFSWLQVDSMQRLLPHMKDDTDKCRLLDNLAGAYINDDFPKSIAYGLQYQALAGKLGWQQGVILAKLRTGQAYLQNNNRKSGFASYRDAYELARKLHYPILQASSLQRLGIYYDITGDYTTALTYWIKANKIAVALNDQSLQTHTNVLIGQIYLQFNDAEKALPYYFKILAYYQAKKDKDDMEFTYYGLSRCYEELKDYDRAILYSKRSLSLGEELHDPQLSPNYYQLYEIYMLKKDYSQAYLYFSQMRHDSHGKTSAAYLSLTEAHFYLVAPDSLLIKDGVKPQNRYTQLLDSFTLFTKKGLPLGPDTYLDISIANQHLHSYQKAYEAYKRYITLRDSLKNNDAINKFTTSMSDYQEAKKEDALRYQQQLVNIRFEQQKKYYLFGVIALAIISFFIFFNYFNQRKANRKITAANHQLSEQQEEITVQRDRLAETIENLKATQSQLIQSEKMASLGELTAGIAHEIQNPLNFVNNFSEVSNELLDEMNEELDKGDISEAKLISNDIKQNLQKINHHGKRADSIVKGMLQHSRQTKGVKEPTNLNALCDEYLRLSYHGLRAKDKSFNADFKMDFDETIGKINIVPQDMGRVLLNLFNNAFYAVNEKKKTADQSYKPLVFVSTKKINDKVEIKVTDNGNGIPQNVTDKIFQPFFTTKPTGQGTGLGLSLSYDIITKEHNGTLKVETKESEGSVFIIKLSS